MTLVINRLSILSCSQSPSPVPGKRSKFDKLQSSPAEKDQKPEWLQLLSKSAHKVGAVVCACLCVCVWQSIKCAQTNFSQAWGSVAVKKRGNFEHMPMLMLMTSEFKMFRPHITGSETGPAETAALGFPPLVSQSARKRKISHSE